MANTFLCRLGSFNLPSFHSFEYGEDFIEFFVGSHNSFSIERPAKPSSTPLSIRYPEEFACSIPGGFLSIRFIRTRRHGRTPSRKANSGCRRTANPGRRDEPVSFLRWGKKFINPPRRSPTNFADTEAGRAGAFLAPRAAITASLVAHQLANFGKNESLFLLASDYSHVTPDSRTLTFDTASGQSDSSRVRVRVA